MQKVYQRINWENEPSEATPLNERNLNKLDYAVDIIDDRVIEYAHYTEDAAASAAAAANSASASANSASASQASAVNSSTSAANAKISEDNAKFSENAAKQSETNASQSEHNAAVSEANTSISEQTADNWRKLSESHNHGNTGVREGEDTDNSKYWSEQSQDSADSAAESATTAVNSAIEAHTDANDARDILEQIKGYAQIIVPSFILDVDTGVLYMSGDVEGIDFTIDEDTCILYYKFIPA